MKFNETFYHEKGEKIVGTDNFIFEVINVRKMVEGHIFLAFTLTRSFVTVRLLSYAFRSFRHIVLL